MHIPARRSGNRGVSLIVTLVMLVVMGLTAATALKSATSNEKVVNNLRVQNLAQQYAEGALRYCEYELVKASASRVSSLADSEIDVTPASDPNWNKSTTWTASPSIATRVTSSFLSSSNSSFTPPKLPECYVERHVYASGGTATVVTSRGFSPDYIANNSGETTNGSVVWLQSILTLR